MVQNKPIRLNKEWVTSSNRHVFLVRLDNDICGYCKTREGAEDLIRSLGSNIETELRKEKHNVAEITKEIIEGENEVPSKVIIYEQALGYVYNSTPKVKHTLTYTSTYKCYFNPEPEQEEEEDQEEKVVEEEVLAEEEVVEEEVVVEETEQVIEEVDQIKNSSHIIIEIHDTVDSIEDVYSNEVDYSDEDSEEESDEDSEEDESNEELEYSEDEYEFERKARRLIERFFSFLD